MAKYNEDIVNEYIKFIDLVNETEDIDILLMINVQSQNDMIRQHCKMHYALLSDNKLIHRIIKENFIRINKKL